MNLHAKDASGKVVASPAFDLVLSYDFQLRKNVMKPMNAGLKLTSALEQAVADVEIKERFFITPCALRGHLPADVPVPALGQGRHRSRSREARHRSNRQRQRQKRPVCGEVENSH